MLSSLTIIDSGQTSFKGAVPITCSYKDGTTAWNYGGTYNSAIPYNNGVDIPGRFLIDADYDINSDSNWVTCTLIDGTSANETAITDALDWSTFKIVWNATGVTNSDNCRIRVRVYNVITATWSDYAYLSDISIASLGYPFFTAGINDSFYVCAFSAAPDYPTAILNVNNNADHKISVRGNVETIKHAVNIQRFSLDFPYLPLADIESFKTFLKNIDYKKNIFRYYQYETNFVSPFDKTWGYTNVRIEDATVNITQERGSAYSLQIKLRKQ